MDFQLEGTNESEAEDIRNAINLHNKGYNLSFGFRLLFWKAVQKKSVLDLPELTLNNNTNIHFSVHTMVLSLNGWHYIY